MINTKSQALSFTIGQGSYAGPAIADYLDQLTQYPFLRYLVLDNPDGTFFDIADARQVEEISRAPRPRFTPAISPSGLTPGAKQNSKTCPGLSRPRRPYTRKTTSAGRSR